MRILISNDDGIESPGLLSLAAALEDLGEVTVVAPHRERSTSGHSLTLHKPLRIFEVGERRYATTGTPADCIYLGIREVMKEKPDLILSGINAGANLGTDVHYSGTVAAAREGALMNIRSYAFSMVELPAVLSPSASSAGNLPNPGKEPMDFAVGARIARRVIDATLEFPFPSHTLIIVNIPNIAYERIQGVRVTRQGFRYYANEVTRRTDPRGKDYYWIGGPYVGFESSELSDCHALNESCVALTPLTIDSTHGAFFTTLSGASLETLLAD